MKLFIAHFNYKIIQSQTPVGSDYKDLTMNYTLGMPMKISDYVPRNKLTLVDFLASWCAPCRHEIPNIIKLYNQYKDRGFGVISIMGIPYTLLIDQNGKILAKGLRSDELATKLSEILK